LSDTSIKPIIAVTASALDQHTQRYIDGVERSNGEPWVILPEHGVDASEFMAKANALVLTGGEDVHPSRYESLPLATRNQTFNEPRDAMEAELLKAALNDDMPVYGICRGMQLLNVVLGGSLTELAGHSGTFTDDGEVATVAYHRIFISPGSKLAAVVGSGGIVRVNSIHFQGVREAQKSPLLMAGAYSLEDGVIEALESPSHRWVIGVQFHPERRMELPPHFDRLFQSLVERAEERLFTTQKT
jgi:putative glutamine amidotransferase